MSTAKHPDDASTILAAPCRPLESRAGRYRLTVTEGPDAGLHVELDGASPQRLLIGQGPACALRLTDRHASRRHLAAEATERGLHVSDLASKNGTFVAELATGAGGVRVAEAWLRGGETLVIGASRLRVELIAGEAPIALPADVRFGRVIGGSVAMRRLYPLLARLATTAVPVIIEGETGTGKELLAEAIHEEGPRAKGPFVVFDCTTVSPNLIESALFGHEKGAFTGAVAVRRGVFEQADGGTLLIDEIGDLDLSLQSKLLRAIERAEVQRVGGDRYLRADVRVIAATRRDLDVEVAEKRFRDDLFFRLAVARVELPPLRARAGDVGLLARHFWRELGSDDEPLPPAMLARLETYGWPGNVRELYNLVARRRALGDLAADGPLGEALPSAGGSTKNAPGPADAVERVLARDLPFLRARDELLRDFERRYVERAIVRYGGNVSRAAAASGIARRYFYDLKKRAGG